MVDNFHAAANSLHELLTPVDPHVSVGVDDENRIIHVYINHKSVLVPNFHMGFKVEQHVVKGIRPV